LFIKRNDIFKLLSTIAHLQEIAYRPVVGPLMLSIEITGRQFAFIPMIMHADAAFMLPFAWLIRAIAHFFIVFADTIHHLPPFSKCPILTGIG
jgi:hypothetical protein